MNIFIEEHFIDKTRNISQGASDVYETDHSAVGSLYKALVKEHGRCVGKVHIDTKDGVTKTIGWVFTKRVQYEDIKKYYLRETWVTLHKSKPHLQCNFMEI